MTAEGDNSVLMQKVAKEHLSMFKPHELKAVSKVDPASVDDLIYLIKRRENEHFQYLRGKIGKAMFATTVQKKMPSFLSSISKSLEEKGVFNTWMYQEQDHIQAFAKAYAERLISLAFADVLKQKDVVGTDLEPMLTKVFHLFLLDAIENDLSWFLENNILTVEQGQEVKQ